MPDNRLKTSLGLLIAILAVSAASIFVRFAQADGAPSLVIAALRLTFATLLLAPLALIRYRSELQKLTRREISLGAISGLFLAVHFATWITSLEYTTVASSVVLVTTAPLWVALVSPLLLKERLTRAAIVGLVLALAGGIIIGLADACGFEHGLSCPDLRQALQGRAMWGNFLALAGAWAVSDYLIVGRKVRAGLSLVPYVFLVYGIGAIFLLMFMALAGETPSGYSSGAYLWILLLTVIPQLIGHSAFNWLLKYLPATMVSVSTLAEPIGSAALAMVFLNETPPLAVLFGGVLILTGIYLTTTQGKG